MPTGDEDDDDEGSDDEDMPALEGEEEAEGEAKKADA
jgi:hypothetical protein